MNARLWLVLVCLVLSVACSGGSNPSSPAPSAAPAADLVIVNGTVIIPAVLAVAENSDVSGEQLLRAIVIGYEVTARISLAMGTDASHHGFHKTSVVGPVASAIAAACVLNLNTAQITCAAGIAA